MQLHEQAANRTAKDETLASGDFATLWAALGEKVQKAMADNPGHWCNVALSNGEIREPFWCIAN